MTCARERVPDCFGRYGWGSGWHAGELSPGALPYCATCPVAGDCVQLAVLREAPVAIGADGTWVVGVPPARMVALNIASGMRDRAADAVL